MTVHKYYIGGMGPHLYDDTVELLDPEEDFPGEYQSGFLTSGPIKTTYSAVADDDVVRLGDLDLLSLWADQTTYIEAKNNTGVTIADTGNTDRAALQITKEMSGHSLWIYNGCHIDVTRTGGTAAGAMSVLYSVSATPTDSGGCDVGFSSVANAEAVGCNIFGMWAVAGSPTQGDGADYAGTIGMEINTHERYADSGYMESRSGRYSVGLQMIPENRVQYELTGSADRGYNGNFGIFIGEMAEKTVDTVTFPRVSWHIPLYIGPNATAPNGTSIYIAGGILEDSVSAEDNAPTVGIKFDEEFEVGIDMTQATFNDDNSSIKISDGDKIRYGTASIYSSSNVLTLYDSTTGAKTLAELVSSSSSSLWTAGTNLIYPTNNPDIIFADDGGVGIKFDGGFTTGIDFTLSTFSDDSATIKLAESQKIRFGTASIYHDMSDLRIFSNTGDGIFIFSSDDLRLDGKILDVNVTSVDVDVAGSIAVNTSGSGTDINVTAIDEINLKGLNNNSTLRLYYSTSIAVAKLEADEIALIGGTSSVSIADSGTNPRMAPTSTSGSIDLGASTRYWGRLYIGDSAYFNGATIAMYNLPTSSPGAGKLYRSGNYVMIGT